MSTDPNNTPHPIPRDADEASFSEMVPLKSTKINIIKSPLLWLLLPTAIVAIVSFRFLQGFEAAMKQGNMNVQAETFMNFAFLAVAYLLLVTLIVVYLYSKTDKPIWMLFLNFGFVAALLKTPIGIPYFLFFRSLLPGNWAPNNNDMFRHFTGMFFGAGLMEEFMKVTLVLIGGYITYKAARGENPLPDVLYKALRIRGPLDGLLMGVFGGAGFILIETWGQYLILAFNSTVQQGGSNEAGFLISLMLLVPRVVGGMIGHMAWAGITGYAIGLAVLRPSGNWWKIIGVAWLLTSLLHAIWNTENFVPIFVWVSGLSTLVIFIACFLKARQIEQSAGRETDSYGSIVVEKAPAPAAAPPAPAPAPAATAKAEAPIAIAIGDFQVALTAGKVMDLGAEPALGGKGAGILGEVTQHPTRPDVLGLKNTGEKAWTATLRDGSTTTIESGRNLRLAPGVKVDFGGLNADVIAL
ncbi:MAG: PrsW family intramembrane metalloprotease [Pseudomonadota bacterium]